MNMNENGRSLIFIYLIGKRIMRLLKRYFRFYIFLCIISVVWILNCSSEKNLMGVSGDWVSDIPFELNYVNLRIPHDNRIFETDHFLVFSDASSDDVKIEFARKAEWALDEVLNAFNIENASTLGVRIRDQNSKITIYSMKIPTHTQLSFPYGFLLYGEDSEIVQKWPKELQPRYYNEVKHEIVHVVQFLLGVLPDPENRENEPDRWFNEGLAEYVSDGFFVPIMTKSDYVTWKYGDGHINPISIHQWGNLPVPASRVSEYYPMFGLAVKYLLDENGMGRSLEDVVNMFLYMTDNHIPFSQAFEQYMGLGLDEYEKTFFNRLDEYFNLI